MTRLAGVFTAAGLAASLAAACASAPAALAQMPPQGMNPPMSSIQPETTITLTGRGTVDHAPDIAMISLGVQVEAETASAAMTQQAEKMNGVLAAVKASGVADRDMQTSNLSLNPVYDYPNNQRPRLRAYAASNQLTIKVRDLANLGRTLDAVVKAGGNTINGVSFGIDKPEAFQNEARVSAIKDAATRAELYAQAVGYRVKRIVTVTENEYYAPPMPMMMNQRMEMDAANATPVAAGEVSLTATVSVMFELTR
ncbi:MAG: SIMPL domain-containing protein [Alphaproteobacteria bacterium]|nr:SIMPL domain-containing protein [Alphaproteobacteria bacterium]